MTRESLSLLAEDRFALCLGFAIASHAVLIFGVVFSTESPPDRTPKLEISLASFKSDNTPEDVAFLAQANQEGSGTLEEKAELTTTDISAKRALEIDQTAKTAKTNQSERRPTGRKILTTVNSTLYNTQTELSDRKTEQQQIAGEDNQDQISKEIASLEAKLARLQQAYAKRPKVYRITSVATKAAEDAAYQLAWQQKVEYAGNKNYPAQAQREGIEGDVRLMVALLPDGSIRKIIIMASSGSPLLDSAAVRSIHLAAPFAPFPPKISRKADVLEIIRTWQFRRDGFSSRG
ncbi:MAG: protein TonB [Pseudomonadales bacterium]|jgi:protein TonB